MGNTSLRSLYVLPQLLSYQEPHTGPVTQPRIVDCHICERDEARIHD